MKAEEKLYHAYIITGPQGELCEKKAKELSKAIVCGRPSPCGTCPHCRKAEEGIHPDIIEVGPLEGKRMISVQQIREVRSDAYTVPNDAKEKVYVIRDAGSMNPSAQNAFLKVLEEPPSFTHFILLAQNAGELLQTVRSRCKQILIAPQGEESAEKSEEAAAFLHILSQKDRLGLLGFIGELEKMSGAEGMDFFRSLKAEAAKELRNPKKISAQKAMEILKEADTALRYLSVNVSMGHIAGHILSVLL